MAENAPEAPEVRAERRPDPILPVLIERVEEAPEREAGRLAFAGVIEDRKSLPAQLPLLPVIGKSAVLRALAAASTADGTRPNPNGGAYFLFLLACHAARARGLPRARPPMPLGFPSHLLPVGGVSLMVGHGPPYGVWATAYAHRHPSRSRRRAWPRDRERPGWAVMGPCPSGSLVRPRTSRRLKAAAAMSDRSMQSLGVEAAELLIERYETR